MTTANTVAAGAETPAALSNDKRKTDFLKQVGKFGEESALGRDALPKLAHAVVKAVADGIINMDEKDDKGNDAATQIYEKYAAQETKKALHERSAAGKKANISKLRQLMQMGAMTTIDPVEQMQKAFEARENMIADDNKVKGAYPFYIDVARKQLSQTTALTDRELESIAMKDAPEPKELEVILRGIMKKLEGLVTGENRDNVKDEDELTEAAFQAIKERLDKIATLRAHGKLRADAAKLGIKIA
jgi:hypothetical protein